MKSMDQVMTRDANYLATFYNKLFTNRFFFLYKLLEASFESGIKGYWNKVFVIEGNIKNYTSLEFIPKGIHCSHSGSSLGPGSAVGEKGKKRSQIGKNGNRREPRGARHPFPSPDYLSTRFARRFCFFRQSRFLSPFSHNAEPGPRLLRKISF